MINKKTVVLGASTNPERYSYLAVNKLRNKGHDVIAIGNHTGKVGDVDIVSSPVPADHVNTVTMYLNPLHQPSYYDYIFSLHPERIIFNPGAENEELASLAKNKGILTQEACTLVLLSTGQY
ncbi:MAG: CoA-binding protein [Ginsengibacter sp.]